MANLRTLAGKVLLVFFLTQTICSQAHAKTTVSGFSARLLASQVASHIAYFAHNLVHLLHKKGDVFIGHNFSSNREKFLKLHEGDWDFYLTKTLISSPPGAGVAVHSRDNQGDTTATPAEQKKEQLEDVAKLAAGPIVGAIVHWLILRGALGRESLSRANMHALMHLADLIVLPCNKKGEFPKVMGVELRTDGSQIAKRLGLSKSRVALASVLSILAFSTAAYFGLIHNSGKQQLKELGVNLLTDSVLPIIINSVYANW